MDAGTTLVLLGTHTMTREGLKLVFEATGRMTVVGETGCPEEAVRISDRVKPDILVIDFVGQGARALRAIQRLRARKPETNVLVLTDPEQQESLDTIIEAGAQGCIGKNGTAEDLVIAVDLVSAGRMRLPHRASQLVRRRIVTNKTGTEARLARLNEKERKIVMLTARGFTSKEIGRHVFMTAASVDLASAWRAHFRTKWYCGRGSLNSRFQPLLLAWLIGAAACDRPAGTDTGLPGGAPFLERDSAGVLVATTPGTRARAPAGWVVDTVPEYQIGEVEGEDPYLFSRIEGVQQLSDGRIVVLDRADCELRFFDTDGVFLEHKGGRGEGPGEFQPNSRCHLEPSPGNDSLYVHSARIGSTVSLFDDHGRFSHRVVATWDGQPWDGRYVWRVHGVAGGRFLGENRTAPLFNENPAARTAGLAPDPGMAYYALFDVDTGIPVWEGSFQGAHEYRAPLGGLYDLPFDIWPAGFLGRNSLFLTLGENRGPEILEYDMSGSLRRIIRLAEAVVEPSREDIDELVEFQLAPWDMTPEDREHFTEVQLGDYAEMPLPEIMPVFSRLLVDEVGWLWAELYRFDVRAPMTWLVFGPNGEGFGSVDMPPGLDIWQIGRDFVLGVWLDELEVEYVRRHALTGRP